MLDAALRLADELGIETLTMRKLAHELGVEAMSLYNHVANKSDLVDAIVDRVVEEIELPVPGTHWEAALRSCALSARAAYLRHPWSCPLVMAPTLTGVVAAPRLAYVEALLACLHDAGFSEELTYRGYHAIDSHVLGFTMWQLGHAIDGEDLDELAATFMVEMASTYPNLVAHARQHLERPRDGGASEFAFGLDLILDGLARAHTAQ